MSVLTVSTGDTAPKSFLVKDNGVAKDITGYTITCRIATPTVTVKPASILNAETGQCIIIWGGITPGTYSAQFVLTVDGVSEISQTFTIVVEAAI